MKTRETRTYLALYLVVLCAGCGADVFTGEVPAMHGPEPVTQELEQGEDPNCLPGFCSLGPPPSLPCLADGTCEGPPYPNYPGKLKGCQRWWFAVDGSEGHEWVTGGNTATFTNVGGDTHMAFSSNNDATASPPTAQIQLQQPFMVGLTDVPDTLLSGQWTFEGRIAGARSAHTFFVQYGSSTVLGFADGPEGNTANLNSSDPTPRGAYLYLAFEAALPGFEDGTICDIDDDKCPFSLEEEIPGAKDKCDCFVTCGDDMVDSACGTAKCGSCPGQRKPYPTRKECRERENK